MSAPRRLADSGTTLLELLAAVAILATIAGLLYGTFSRALATRTYATAAMERYARARVAIDWLEDDLAGSYVAGLYPTGGKRFFSTGRADEPTLGGTPLLDVTTASARGTTALVGPILDIEGPRDRGDQVRVLYHLEQAASGRSAAGSAGLDLVRYEHRPPTDVKLEEASRAVVARGIASVELRFFDGGAWRDTWDAIVASSAPVGQPGGERMRSAPVMVRIRVRLADAEEPAELVSAVRLALGGRRD